MKLKHLFLTLLALLAITTNSVAATKIGDFYYYGNGVYLVLTYESRISSENYPNMEEANIPSRVGDRTTEEVRAVGDSAFFGCKSLRSVTIPELMLPSAISQSAFVSCPNLTSIRWLSIYTYNYSKKEDAPFYPIRDQISTMYCGTTIPAYLCYEMENLSTVTISDTVYRIGNYAFYGCKKLTSIYIPKKVSQIGEQAFHGCDSIRTFGVSPDNSWFCEVDGVLFNKDTTQLVYYPKAKQGAYVVPACVKYIGNDAFRNCKYLTSIQLPDSLISIGDYAFMYCNELIAIDIPKKISSVGKYAFAGCGKLESINIEASTPPSTGGYTIFDNPPPSSIYVPCGTLEVYKTNKDWSRYSGAIKDIPLPYDVTIIPSSNGKVDIPTSCSGSILKAMPDSGCHFVQWSDGVTDNPRTIELTQDTTFEALFAPNIYTLNLQTDNAEMGTVSGEGSFEYQTEVSISATPNYGYHFVQWSGFGKQTQNAITASQAYSIAAALASGEKTSTQYTIIGYVTGKYGTYTNSYYLSDSPNVTGKFIAFKCTSSANVGDYVKVTGYLTNYQGTTPETSSGATLTKLTQTTYTANPYAFKLTQDTTITAEFAKNTYTLTVQSANTSMGSVTGSGSYEYLSNRSISATAKNGYHFAQWSDGNTDNPRTIELTQDTLFKAQFEKNVYSLEVLANNAEMGTVSGSGSYEYQTQVSVLATANYGYHFAKWSDGVTVNLRSVTITQNMSLTAIFEKNQYTISDNSDQKQGYISGVGSYDYLSKVDLTAVNQYGYHFVQWSDGIKETKRSIELTQDTAFEALFAKNPVITYSCDQTMGKIIGDTTLASEPTGKVTFEAVPNYGYHFVQWSDGKTDNPRTIELMQDTAFTAVLAIDRSGKCGVDNQLTWQYDVKAKTLTISGVGSLASNYTFGVEAPTQMKQLIIGNEVTAIGAKAFYAMTTINHLTIGSGVTSIGDNAFAECKNFDDITCYATDVPVITAKTFANVGNKQYIYLFVPEGRERAYQRDVYWGEFDVQVKNADKVTDPVEDVLVVPTDNTVEITWPAVSEAETYEIAITRDGKVICSLIFNTEGQLTGIAFAPGRNGANYTQKAQTTGFRFTVTGLTSNTHYGFSIVAKDNAEQSLDTKSGSFTTTGVATGMDKVSNDQSPATSKILRNNQLFILRGEKIYTVTGQEIK